MCKVRYLILLSVLLAACGSIGGDLPGGTAVPESDEAGLLPGDDAAPDSPRVASPAATGLPPTWTPLPTESAAAPPQTSDTPGGLGSDAEGGTAVPSYAGPSTTYVVKRGDTLAEICIKYSVPITQVAQINNITDWDHIEVGQVLIIPEDE